MGQQATSWEYQNNRYELLSSCGRYQYASREVLSDSPKVCCFIMLNPAGRIRPKPGATRRKCIKFARENGCGTLLTCNLFAFATPDPKHLWQVSDPIGPENDHYIAEMIRKAVGGEGMIVCAWGREGRSRVKERARQVLAILEAENTAGRVCALRINADGSPQHPARASLPPHCVPYPKSN